VDGIPWILDTNFGKGYATGRRKERKRILIMERKISVLRLDVATQFGHYLAKKKRRPASSLALQGTEKLLIANSLPK
jgi:hypothetical protein